MFQSEVPGLTRLRGPGGPRGARWHAPATPPGADPSHRLGAPKGNFYHQKVSVSLMERVYNKNCGGEGAGPRLFAHHKPRVAPPVPVGCERATGVEEPSARPSVHLWRLDRTPRPCLVRRRSAVAASLPHDPRGGRHGRKRTPADFGLPARSAGRRHPHLHSGADGNLRHRRRGAVGGRVRDKRYRGVLVTVLSATGRRGILLFSSPLIRHAQQGCRQNPL